MGMIIEYLTSNTKPKIGKYKPQSIIGSNLSIPNLKNENGSQCHMQYRNE